jgi:hypothetical protein
VSAEILASFERSSGSERVVLYWTNDGQRHFLEVARERKTFDGWTLMYRIAFPPAEVFNLHDAVGAACDLAGGVRR